MACSSRTYEGDSQVSTFFLLYFMRLIVLSALMRTAFQSPCYSITSRPWPFDSKAFKVSESWISVAFLHFLHYTFGQPLKEEINMGRVSTQIPHFDPESAVIGFALLSVLAPSELCGLNLLKLCLIFIWWYACSDVLLESGHQCVVAVQHVHWPISHKQIATATIAFSAS